MEITLEKIELVKDRTGVSYKEAKEALEKSEGSVVDAIIDIEERIDEGGKTNFAENGTKIVDKIKELVKKGNVSKIIIRKEDEVLLNLPLNIGIVGTVLAPWAMIAGVIAAFGTKCSIELLKDDGEIIDISEMATETVGDIVEKGSVLADEVREKGADVYSSVKSKAGDALNKVNIDMGINAETDTKEDTGCFCDDMFDEDNDLKEFSDAEEEK